MRELLSIFALFLITNGNAPRAGAAPSSEVPQGPSFNCKNARGYAERTICVDEELSAYDRAIALLYRMVKRENDKHPDHHTSARSQLDWMKERNSCRRRACLIEAHRSRLVTLYIYSWGEDRTNFPTYVSDNKDAELEVIDLGSNWHAFRSLITFRSAGGLSMSEAEYGLVRLVNGRGTYRYVNSNAAIRFEKSSSNVWLLQHQLDPSINDPNESLTGRYVRARN